MPYKFKSFKLFKDEEKSEHSSSFGQRRENNPKSSFQLRYKDKLTSKKAAEFEAWAIAQNINDSTFYAKHLG